jgi:Sulfotransferase family
MGTLLAMTKGARGDISIAAPGRLAWIFGSSRSGSTWLLRMLSQLDRVVPVDDPHLGHHLGVWRPIPLAWATAKEPPKLGTLADYKRQKRDYLFSDHYREQWMPALRELIQARYEAQAAEDIRERGIEDPVVVVKEPGSHAADTLIDLFPQSALIFLLRDGRDVVDSWLDAYSDGSWATDEGAYPLSEEGRTALIRWQSSVWLHRTEVVQETFDRHHPDRRLMVRYEQLRDDPVPSLTSICRLLGVEASEQSLARIASANSYAKVPVHAKGSGQEIRRAEPGGWAETMSREEIDAMHEILSDKLTELGYLTPGDVPSPGHTPFFRRRAA